MLLLSAIPDHITSHHTQHAHATPEPPHTQAPSCTCPSRSRARTAYIAATCIIHASINQPFFLHLPALHLPALHLPALHLPSCPTATHTAMLPQPRHAPHLRRLGMLTTTCCLCHTALAATPETPPPLPSQGPHPSQQALRPPLPLPQSPPHQAPKSPTSASNQPPGLTGPRPVTAGAACTA
jgi:hypothetical protein